MTAIHLRAPTAKLTVIDRAAKTSKKTRAAFMLDASYEKAQNVVADQTRFVMSSLGVAAF